ncbi:hypothetical protein GOODEAATRI_013626 [Goodea atripinnis]|uniref:Uncharacterized protein n=1 Tax=Goodea atripinnis TaxID=208336 RepID=A0ABV0PDX1_9TELE
MDYFPEENVITGTPSTNLLVMFSTLKHLVSSSRLLEGMDMGHAVSMDTLPKSPKAALLCFLVRLSSCVATICGGLKPFITKKNQIISSMYMSVSVGLCL